RSARQQSANPSASSRPIPSWLGGVPGLVLVDQDNQVSESPNQAEQSTDHCAPGSPAEVMIQSQANSQGSDHLEAHLRESKVEPEFSRIQWALGHRRPPLARVSSHLWAGA